MAKRKRQGRVVGRRYGKRARIGTFVPPYRKMSLRTREILGVELKYFDTTKTDTTVSATWAGGEIDPAGNCLFYPTRGSAGNNRDGDKCIMKQIMIRGAIYRNQGSDQADVNAPTSVRVALVLDRQTNGAQLNAEDVYDTTVHAASEQQFAFRKLDSMNRYQILWSQLFSLHDNVTMADGANTASKAGISIPFTVIKNVNIPVAFTGNAGSVADISNNSLHVIACGSIAIDTIHYAGRIRFIG